jgi:hypothetical protein
MNFFDRSSGSFGDFAAGSTSYTGDSSAVIFSVEGAVAASLFRSSSSLQRKAKGKKSYTNSKGRRQVKKKYRVGKITTRKTLIHGPIICGALSFGAPRITIRGAPHIGAPQISSYPWRTVKEMRHG